MLQPDELKLTDVGIDCLERILRYLPLNDLMNVADTNKQLKEVAELVFLLKHGNTILRILGFDFPINKFFENRVEICSVDLKIILQLLRCFGYLLHRLEIDIDIRKRLVAIDNVELVNVYIDHLIVYIKQYCVETLTELNISNSPNGLLNRFEGPFPNVHTAFVRSSDLPNVSLNEFFPKLKRLTYRCHQISDLANIESNIQTLDHLEIINWCRENNELFRTIQLNPRLQSLGVPFFVIYQGINEKIPHLTDLRVDATGWSEIDPIEFHFKTVKRLEIQYDVFRQRLFSSENLDELVLKFSASQPLRNLEEEFYKFIARHTSVRKLKIIATSLELKLPKLQNMLPLLEEFDVPVFFLLRDVLRFMKNQKMLKVMKIYLQNYRMSRDYDVVQMQLNKEWRLLKTKLRINFIFVRN